MQWNGSTFSEGYNSCQKQGEEAMSFIPVVIFLNLPNSLCSYKSNSIFFSSLQGFEILRASVVGFYFPYSALSSFCTFLMYMSLHTLFSVPFSQLLNAELCKKSLKQSSWVNWITDLKAKQNRISRVLYLYDLRKRFRTASKICNAIKILCSGIGTAETNPLQCFDSMINISNGCVYCKLGAPSIGTWIPIRQFKVLD